MEVECDWQEAGNDTEIRPAVNECAKNESEDVGGCCRNVERCLN